MRSVNVKVIKPEKIIAEGWSPMWRPPEIEDHLAEEFHQQVMEDYKKNANPFGFTPG